jgi:hypothetical protein
VAHRIAGMATVWWHLIGHIHRAALGIGLINHWPDELSSDEPSLLNTTVGHVRPWWPLLHVGPPAGGRTQAGVPQPHGHHAAVDEADVAEAEEAVEDPRAADDVAVADGREDAAAAAVGGGGAAPGAVRPRETFPAPARSPNSSLSW